MIRKAIPPPIRNGENSENTLLKNFIMISKFINAQANKITASSEQTTDRIIFLFIGLFSGGTELLC